MGFQIDNQKLRALRLNRGWTQAELAALLNISERSVQRIEATGALSNESLRAICALFEIDRVTLIRPEAKPWHFVLHPNLFWIGLIFGISLGMFLARLLY